MAHFARTTSCINTLKPSSLSAIQCLSNPPSGTPSKYWGASVGFFAPPESRIATDIFNYFLLKAEPMIEGLYYLLYCNQKFFNINTYWHIYCMRCVCVCVYPTISDKCPTSQHSSQHELGHSQHSTCEPAHYGHAEEEVILIKDREEKIGGEEDMIFKYTVGQSYVGWNKLLVTSV